MYFQQTTKIMNKLISNTQSGFLKGRNISECTRLINDLIESTEEQEVPGLMIMLDFEKAFDSVEWGFIDRTLSFFGFGDSLIRWIKTFYSGISSCIINNGHCSSFFQLQRGVRQGDPLSSYIFILVVELLKI